MSAVYLRLCCLLPVPMLHTNGSPHPADNAVKGSPGYENRSTACAANCAHCLQAVALELCATATSAARAPSNVAQLVANEQPTLAEYVRAQPMPATLEALYRA